MRWSLADYGKKIPMTPIAQWKCRGGSCSECRENESFELQFDDLSTLTENSLLLGDEFENWDHYPKLLYAQKARDFKGNPFLPAFLVCPMTIMRHQDVSGFPKRA